MDSLTREPVELLTRSRSRRWLMLGLCLLTVAGIGYAIWFWPAGSANQTARDRNANQPIPVVVAAAEQKDVPIYLDGLGTVQAYNTVTVRAMVDGPLVKVNFVEGQDVKKGDLLAQIDPRTYQAALDQAAGKKAQDEAQLANARLDLARYQKLVANNYSSAQQADTARAQVAQLEAQVTQDQAQIDTARTQLGYTTIIAPLEGRTGMRQVDAGNIVHAADTTGMVMITQLHPISAMFTLPQQSLPAVANAMRGDAPKVLAYVQGAAGSPAGVLDTGVLAVLDNQVDPTTGTIKLKATFPNSGDRLWPGAFVGVQLQVDTAKDAVVVPSAAVQRGPRGAYVYVIDQNNTASRRNVTVGHEDAQGSIITEGVKPGDKVVIDGASRLSDATKVTVVQPTAAGTAPTVGQPAAPGTRRRQSGGAG
ncbi:MAG TPA: efflux RND transporter periplasmic adaptor subunit [Acetobacteraceae bacterium]|jgi:membrane fusion protein, multidrug efflux system|nr:efflux RND transporter periplasmic adaptor subunit [Acetobacteraceae bacterium]